MKTILVTGGCGFIGSNFIRRTLATIPDINIVNVDVMIYSGHAMGLAEFREDPRYTFYLVDIGNHLAVKEILAKHVPDYVVNFAAHTHVDRSIDDPQPFIDTNIVGTFRLLEEIRRYKRPDDFKFVHISTDEVYGSALGEPFTEETAYDPSSPYSASKAASDHLVKAYYRTYGLPAVITNCCNNYGPYQFPEKLIPLMILNGVEGRELPVYGTGGNIRDWIHVDDHVDALWCVIAKGEVGGTYNIGANCELSNLEVVHKICDRLDELSAIGIVPARDYRELVKFVGDRPGHDLVYSVCNHKLLSLGWRPIVKFDDGLANTISWYCDNIDWVAKIHDRRRLGNA